MRTLSMHLRVGAVRTTILTAFARASVLARPTGATIPEDSRLFATQDELASVLPLPEKKGKRKDDVVDEARVSIIAKMAAADALLRTVYVKHPNYETIVKEFLASGLEGLLERVPLTVGIPLHPTLGSPTRSLDEIYERLGDLPFAAEYKYDGQRAQIHVVTTSNGIDVKIFSRHLEDMTDKYPDIVIMMKRYCEEGPPIPPSASSSPNMLQSDVPADRKAPVSLIIDSEIVAWDAKNNITKSFQELSNRPRKDVKLHQVNIPVCLFVFDLMYLNGEQLLSVPFRERRRLLQETLPPREMPTSPGGARLKHVTSLDSDCPGGRDEIEAFWEVAVDSQCEGLMIKLLDSGEVVEEVQPLNPGSLPPSPSKRPQTRKKPLPATYEPDKRTSAWLKLKKDYVKGIGDTLDLVPIGAWHGNGRKAQWWSPILLAVWDEKQGRLVAVCKCMSGFTDAFYKSLNEQYAENSSTCSKDPLGDYDVGGLRPTVYFEPREVWEVACAEITISPVSVAALGEVSADRGLSARFPRFLKVREDKRIEDATPATMLAQLWRKQDTRGRTDGAGEDDGDLVDVDIPESEAEDEYEEEENI
ncbi:ATP-dependent DNA ligase [Clavulina sp. PMI_390]|nr:ATP-dependent DNA ligase [Clavulina sp. PMI_390]